MSNYRKVRVSCELRPAYYDKFQCLMSGCQLNCCKDSWRITFDRKDYLELKSIKGSDKLNQRLAHKLRRIRRGKLADSYFAEFDMSDGVCPLLNENGLCMLQLEIGEQVQPRVCHVFPRGESYTAFGYFERSLSPGCEGVLELLWNLPEGVDFISEPLSKEMQMPVTTNQGCPFSVFESQEIRSVCIDILQARRFSLPQRFLLMGIVLKELADGETNIAGWQERAQALVTAPQTFELLQSLSSSSNERSQAQALFQNLHVLNSISVKNMFAFRILQEEISNALHAAPPVNPIPGIQISFKFGNINASLPSWLETEKRFEERFQGKEYFMENLMVSLFFHLGLPVLDTPEQLWESYVNFCSLYSFYHFMAVMSCREGAAGDKAELFKMMVQTSRRLIHDSKRKTAFGKEFFKNDSATLAHMAILLGV